MRHTGFGPDEGLYLADGKLPKLTNILLRHLEMIIPAFFPPTRTADGGRGGRLRRDFTIKLLLQNRALAIANGRDPIRAIGKSGGGLSAGTIAERSGLKANTLRSTLSKLSALGLLTHIGKRGGYALTDENIERILPLLQTVPSAKTTSSGRGNKRT